MSDVWRPVAEQKSILCACGYIPCADSIYQEDGNLFVGLDIGTAVIALPDNVRLCELVPAEQPVAPMPDWTAAPEWAEWAAVTLKILGKREAAFQWCWLQEEPENTGGAIVANGRYRFGDEAPVPFGIDFRMIKQRRPQVTP